MSSALVIVTQCLLSIVTGVSAGLNTTLLIYILRRNSLAFKDKCTISLIFCDLSRALIGYFCELVLSQLEKSKRGEFCNYVGFVISFLSYTAVNHLALLTVDRWFCIARPARQNCFHSRLGQMIAPLCCWLAGVSLGVFPFFGFGVYGTEFDDLRCSVDWRRRALLDRIYHILLFVCCYVFPLLSMTLSFIFVRSTLRKSRVTVSDNFESATERVVSNLRIKAEKRNAVMSFTLAFVFVVAWTPYAALSFVNAFMEVRVSINAIVQTIAVLPAKASTMYNPIIYAGYDKEFKKYLWKLGRCKRVAVDPLTQHTIDRRTTSSLRERRMASYSRPDGVTPKDR